MKAENNVNKEEEIGDSHTHTDTENQKKRNAEKGREMCLL